MMPGDACRISTGRAVQSAISRPTRWGTCYAAQFFEQARKDVGDLEEQFARGEFAGLLNWLREKIHRQGRRIWRRDLVRKVTGRDLGAEPLLAQSARRAAEVYGV